MLHFVSISLASNIEHKGPAALCKRKFESAVEGQRIRFILVIFRERWLSLGHEVLHFILVFLLKVFTFYYDHDLSLYSFLQTISQLSCSTTKLPLLKIRVHNDILELKLSLRHTIASCNFIPVHDFFLYMQ